MKYGILHHADQPLHLRKPEGQLLHLTHFFEKNRWLLCLLQRFFQFLKYPLPGQSRQIHGLRQRNRLRRNGKFEPGSKLGRPKNPQRIFRESFIVHMTQHFCLQITDPAEMIQHFAGKHILHQCIHGKIPPHGRLFGTKPGIHVDVKIFVAAPRGFLFPWHGNIQIITPQSEDPKACAHLGTFSQMIQDICQRFRRYAVDFYINVLIFYPCDFVPDASSHEKSSAALLRHTGGDLPCHIQIFVFHPVSSSSASQLSPVS